MPLDARRRRMRVAGNAMPEKVPGRRITIGCVSLWPPVAIAVFTLPFAAVWLRLRDRRGRFALEWREALCWSAVIWAVFAVVVVELLSLGAGHDPNAARGGQLTRGWLLAAWALPARVGSRCGGAVACAAASRLDALARTAAGAGALRAGDAGGDR